MPMAEGQDDVSPPTRRADHRNRIGHGRTEAEPGSVRLSEARKYLPGAAFQQGQAARIGRGMETAEFHGAGNTQPPRHRNEIEAVRGRADRPRKRRRLNVEFDMVATFRVERHGIAGLRGQPSGKRPGSNDDGLGRNVEGRRNYADVCGPCAPADSARAARKRTPAAPAASARRAIMTPGSVRFTASGKNTPPPSKAGSCVSSAATSRAPRSS